MAIPHTSIHLHVYIYMYLCRHIHIHIHIHTHTHIHIHIHTYVRTYIHPYTHTRIHPYIHTSIHPCIHRYIHPFFESSHHHASGRWRMAALCQFSQYRLVDRMQDLWFWSSCSNCPGCVQLILIFNRQGLPRVGQGPSSNVTCKFHPLQFGSAWRTMVTVLVNSLLVARNAHPCSACSCLAWLVANIRQCALPTGLTVGVLFETACSFWPQVPTVDVSQTKIEV
jgi:hypothetical protein